MESQPKTGAVLVIGAGIGGIQASLDLADSGFRVYLVEKLGAIGGTMAALDKTFPTNDCSMCILSPKLVECGRHLNIEILTDSKVEAVDGQAGDFTVAVRQEARYVSPERCTGCGECAKKCPVRTPDPFNGGLSERGAVFRLYEQAYPASFAIDGSLCRDCGICARVCGANAIDFDMKPRTLTLSVGAIIACPGFEPFDPGILDNYGYGLFPNVVTSMEFERILSASGPYGGMLLRPSDMREPKRIGWIQCVGSRDTHRVNNGYCSSVCCTYAVKEAVVAREHGRADLEATIFHIDVRTHGKDFEKYYERAKSLHGVRFVRSEIHRIYQDASKNLILRFRENGSMVEEEFDLVVLSVGMVQGETGRELAARMGVRLNRYGFCRTGSFSPVRTSVNGIFAAGSFSGPKDIPETVTGASAAAAAASALLAPVRHSLTKTKSYPPESAAAGGKPRIGVFICHCGNNIAGTIDIPEVKARSAGLPNVVLVEDPLFACSQDAQRVIRDRISEYGLDRVVVAACTPRTHEGLFRETLREAGLNMYLFEMANIRDQCAWVHQDRPDEATRKAKDLVRMAAARAGVLEPLFQTGIGVERSALVVGGGIAGMVCALAIADQGFGVHLVESSRVLGGNANDILTTIDGEDVRAYLQGLAGRVADNPLISVHTDCRITGSKGYVGNFTTGLAASREPAEREITHGVAVIASGAMEYVPDEYLYGTHPRVFSLTELEEQIVKESALIVSSRNIVLIQCVGSRDDRRPYCSRTCCSRSIKTALALAEVNPRARIYVLYRDIRTYGFLEEYYLEAREKGVMFIRYDPDRRPSVEALPKDGGDLLRVSVTDAIMHAEFFIDADAVGLATGIVPSPGAVELAGFFKVPLNEDGFFMEAHAKLRPVDFPAEGVFLCGLAHGPKLMGESIVQAEAAASRASVILSRDSIDAGGIVAGIDGEKCKGCCLCVDLCPFGAIEYIEEDRRAEVNEAICKGCGVCASSCRSGAADIMGFTDVAIHAMIHNGVLRSP